MGAKRIERKLDDEVLQALLHVGVSGLLRDWRDHQVATINWEGVEHQVERSTFLENGEVELDLFCDDRQLVRESNAWRPGSLVADVPGLGQLRVDAAIAREIDRVQRGRLVRIHAVNWHIAATKVSPSSRSPWFAQLDFGIPDEPHLLELGATNLRARAGDVAITGWGFETSQGFASLFHAEDARWYLAVPSATGTALQPQDVIPLMALVMFALGQPFALGLFHRITDGAISDIVRLPLADWRPRNPSRRQPALPAMHGGYWLSRFVELGLAFMAREPSAPLLTAIHHSVDGFDGLMDSEFLHVWIGAEALAGWALGARQLKNGGQLRIADHNAWQQWVRAHEADIKAHALPGMEQKLFDRVLSSETTTPTTVQRVFRGEGLPWTAELDELERARNGVAHEGGMPGYRTRDFLDDLSKVGLALNVLTTIIAKLIGYDGLISDRSTRALPISGDRPPPWWTASEDYELVTYKHE